MAAATEKHDFTPIVACRDTLRGLREACATSDCPISTDAEIAHALDRLAVLQISLIGLRQTMVGREVNQRFFQCHRSAVVREKSSALIHAWKALVGTRSGNRPHKTKKKTLVVVLGGGGSEDFDNERLDSQI